MAECMMQLLGDCSFKMSGSSTYISSKLVPFSADGKSVLLKKKWTLDFSSALVYNLLRKVLGIEVSDCTQ